MKANSRLWRLLGALISFPILSPALAQEEIIITAPRLAAAPGEAAYAVTRIDAADLAAAPTTRLDATLAGRGGFSLFRRADSRSANPTTQGATLRGLGPNGAGRALVLLDGVPQNDPFGGWVYWSALPQAALEKVALHRGGGAGPFGAGALSGVIDMTSAAPAAGLALDLAGGSFGSGEGALLAGARMGDVGARLSLSGGTSDGFFLLPRSQRGAIDVPAAYDNFAGGLDLATALGGDVMAALRLAGFAERRVNGLAAAPNETEGLEASLRLAREGAAAA
ncbi:MAG: TonB-dependent receptor, partial [Pseudomonadota bacterium]